MVQNKRDLWHDGLGYTLVRGVPHARFAPVMKPVLAEANGARKLQMTSAKKEFLSPVFTGVVYRTERGRDILEMIITTHSQCGEARRYRLTDVKKNDLDACKGSIADQLQEVKARLEDTKWSEASLKDTSNAHFGRNDRSPGRESWCLDCVSERGERLSIHAGKIEIIAT